MSKTSDAPITLTEINFCEHYLETDNPSQSKTLSGLTHTVSQTLKKPAVIKYLESRRRAIGILHNVSPENLVAENTAIAFSSITNVLDQIEPGAPIVIKDISELSYEDRAAIKSIEKKQDGSFKIVMYDKMAAIDKLYRVFGMIKEDGVNIKIGGKSVDVDTGNQSVQVTFVNSNEERPTSEVVDITPDKVE